MIINIQSEENIKKAKSGLHLCVAQRLAVMFFAALLLFCFPGGTLAQDVAPDQSAATAPPIVITGISIEDYAVNIKVQGPIKYSLQKTADPFLVAVVIEGASVGQFRDKILSKAKGIIEVAPAQIEAPSLAARLDIILQAKNDVKAEVTADTLSIRIGKKSVQAATARDSRNLKDILTDKGPDGSSAESSQPRDGAAREITEIYFDKDKNLVELVIKADGKLGEPAVFQLDGSVILEIPGVKSRASIPSKMMPPIKNMTVKNEVDKVRIVITSHTDSQSEVYILDDELLVDFTRNDVAGKKTVTEKDSSARRTIAQGGKVVSLDFQDADIVPILRLLGDVSGYNMVVHPDVKGKITMKLINVPWTQALEIIVRTFNLEKVVEGNIIRIATVKAFQEEQKSAAENKELFTKAEDIVTRIFTVNNADVERLKEVIEKGKLLSPRGTLSIDVRTRSVIVKDIQPAIYQVQKLFETLDRPTQQVLIEARIVEMNTNYSKSLGVQWGMTGKTGSTNSGSFSAAGSQGTSIPGGQSSGSTLFNLPAATSALSPTSAVTFGYLNADKTFGLDLRLSAIETSGKAKIVASPKIMTLDNQKALIKQGKKIPVTTIQSGTSTSVATYSTTYIDANLKLTVTPHISAGGGVLMDIELIKDAPDWTIRDVQGNPAIDTRQASTQVLLMNGETIVIGGIITTSDQISDNNVPGMSKIPLLGELFKQQTREIANTELLIFLTPRIVQ